MKWTLSLLLIPLIFLLDELVKKSRKYGISPSIAEIPSELAVGVSFYDKVIVVKTEEDINMFSAKCPHLGCLINKVNNGKITCPCHGSEFNEEGRNLKGPAASPLKKLEYEVNNENGNFLVKLN